MLWLAEDVDATSAIGRCVQAIAIPVVLATVDAVTLLRGEVMRGRMRLVCQIVFTTLGASAFVQYFTEALRDIRCDAITVTSVTTFLASFTFRSWGLLFALQSIKFSVSKVRWPDRPFLGRLRPLPVRRSLSTSERVDARLR